MEKDIPERSGDPRAKLGPDGSFTAVAAVRALEMLEVMVRATMPPVSAESVVSVRELWLLARRAWMDGGDGATYARARVGIMCKSWL